MDARLRLYALGGLVVRHGLQSRTLANRPVRKAAAKFLDEIVSDKVKDDGVSKDAIADLLSSPFGAEELKVINLAILLAIDREEPQLMEGDFLNQEIGRIMQAKIVHGYDNADSTHQFGSEILHRSGAEAFLGMVTHEIMHNILIDRYEFSPEGLDAGALSEWLCDLLAINLLISRGMKIEPFLSLVKTEQNHKNVFNRGRISYGVHEPARYAIGEVLEAALPKEKENDFFSVLFSAALENFGAGDFNKVVRSSWNKIEKQFGIAPNSYFPIELQDEIRSEVRRLEFESENDPEAGQQEVREGQRGAEVKPRSESRMIVTENTPLKDVVDYVIRKEGVIGSAIDGGKMIPAFALHGVAEYERTHPENNDIDVDYYYWDPDDNRYKDLEAKDLEKARKTGLRMRPQPSGIHFTELSMAAQNFLERFYGAVNKTRAYSQFDAANNVFPVIHIFSQTGKYKFNFWSDIPAHAGQTGMYPLRIGVQNKSFILRGKSPKTAANGAKIGELTVSKEEVEAAGRWEKEKSYPQTAFITLLLYAKALDLIETELIKSGAIRDETAPQSPDGQVRQETRSEVRDQSADDVVEEVYLPNRIADIFGMGATEQPVYNLPGLRDKARVKKSEVQQYIDQDWAELGAVARELSRERGVTVTAKEARDIIVERMEELLSRGLTVGNGGEFEDGRYHVVLTRDSLSNRHPLLRRDVMLVFNDPENPTVERILRLNHISIAFARRFGAFYKGPPGDEPFRGQHAHWDQTYPTSPMNFYKWHIRPLEASDAVKTGVRAEARAKDSQETEELIVPFTPAEEKFFTEEERADIARAMKELRVKGVPPETERFMRAEIRLIQDEFRRHTMGASPSDRLYAKLFDGLIPFLDVLEIEAADLDGAFAYADLVEKKIVIDRSIVEAAYRMRDNPDAAEVKLLLAKLLHEAIHLSQNHRAGMKTAVELYGAGFAVWLDEFLAESAASIFMPVTPDQYAFRESEELIGQLERSGDISPLQAFTLRRQIADRWAYIGLDMSRVINENQITAPTHVSVHGVENLQAALRDRRLEGVPVTDQILAAANGNRLPPQALTRFRIQFYDIHDPGGLELAQRYGAPVINTLGLVGWLERQRIISGLRLAADSGRVVYFDYNLVHAIAETWNRIQITSRLKAAA